MKSFVLLLVLFVALGSAAADPKQDKSAEPGGPGTEVRLTLGELQQLETAVAKRALADDAAQSVAPIMAKLRAQFSPAPPPPDETHPPH